MKKYMFKTEELREGKIQTNLFDSQKEAEDYLSQKDLLDAWDGFDKRIILIEEDEEGNQKELNVIDVGINNYMYYLEIYSKKRVNEESYMFQSRWFDSIKELREWAKNSIDYIDRKNYKAMIMRAPYDKFSDIVGDMEELEEL